MPAVINPFAHPPGTMLSAIQRVGLTSVLCLDAGDINSYDGSSQTWTDVSGQGNHFYRGSGSGSDTYDPAFNGTAGRQSASEYFSSNGDDAFWQTASHSFMNGWHKDGATFAVVAWIFMPTSSSKTVELMRNYFDATDVGSGVFVRTLSSTGKVNVTHINGSAQQILTTTTDDVVVENQWMFVSLSFSEGSGTSFARVNGTVELLSSDTYTSPSASNPSAGIALWGLPDDPGTALYTATAAGNPDSGARLNSLAAFNAFLTQDQVTAIYTMTRGKFGV